MNHSYTDCAIFASLITAPPKINPITHFENEFNGPTGLFSKYKKKVESITKEKIQDDFYSPKAFVMIGEMDLCILSLVDDFVFGSYIFHPDHSFKDKNEDYNHSYDFQTITGYTSNTSIPNKSLIEKWREIFNTETLMYPLMGITKIKVNSAFLIGTGKRFLSLISELININVQKLNLDGKKIDFLLIESFCSYEFTLISFSDSYRSITELVLSVRECDFLELIKDITGHAKKFYNSTDTKSIFENIDFVKNNCILKDWSEKENSVEVGQMINNSHIITTTFTILGYDIDYSSESKRYLSPNKDNPISFLLNFDIKPGHLKTFISQLKEKCNDKSPFSIPTGNEVISLPLSEFKQKNFDLPNPFEIFNDNNADNKKEANDLILNPSNVFNNINKLRTVVKQTIDEKILENIGKLAKKHLRITKKIKDYTFNNKSIQEIHENLKKNKISKVHQLRVIKMFSNYNNGVQDPLLYIYFIELKDLLETVFDTLKEFSDKSSPLYNLALSKKHMMLSSFVNSFEQAYKNRFHQSYRMNNITDFNLEYSGGIQQIISGYNSLYKTILADFFHEQTSSIVYVSGFQGIDANKYDLRINYIHIYVIQFYFSIIIKEATNHYLYWVLNNKKLSDEQKKYFKYISKDSSSYYCILDLRKKIFDFIHDNNDQELNKFLHYVINDNFFKYVFGDQMTFKYGFLNDTELLYYWYWSYFFQTPDHYEKDGSINKEFFILMLLRIIILLIIENEEAFIEKIRNEPPVIELKELWDKYFIEILNFSKWFTSQDEFAKWAIIVRDETNKVFFSAARQLLTDKEDEKISLGDMIENRNKLDEVYIPKISAISLEVRDRLFKNIKADAISFVKIIEKGDIIEYTHRKNYSPQAYILTIIHAYLLKLKKYNNGKIYLLDRSQDSVRKSLETIPSNSILIDPSGGVFILGNKARQDHFKFRCSIINSLIDFSMKQKKQDILKIK